MVLSPTPTSVGSGCGPNLGRPGARSTPSNRVLPFAHEAPQTRPPRPVRSESGGAGGAAAGGRRVRRRQAAGADPRRPLGRQPRPHTADGVVLIRPGRPRRTRPDRPGHAAPVRRTRAGHRHRCVRRGGGLTDGLAAGCSGCTSCIRCWSMRSVTAPPTVRRPSGSPTPTPEGAVRPRAARRSFQSWTCRRLSGSCSRAASGSP